ncbi:MAG TPA: hypothetical protein VM056_07575 [Terriglobales bacterium]|nr:hypothetical protein [Terriglobales bacterium]
MKLVLAIGYNDALLAARKAFLEQQGFAVLTAQSRQEIIQQLIEADCDAAILCQSTPPKERENISRIFSRFRPLTPLVVLSPMEELDHLSGRTITSHPNALPQVLQELFTNAA